MNIKNFHKAVAVGVVAITFVSPVSSQEEPPIAIINGYEITASDVDAQISKMPLGDQVSVRSNPEKFAESLIQEEVLFQYVLETQLVEESELRNELKTIAVNHLIEKYVTSKLVVSDEEIKQYYDANTSSIRGETIQVSHILTESLAKCESIVQRLDAGESFAKLATTHSLHSSSAEQGGALGSLMNHDGPLGFEQELFDIPENQHTIFESAEGCHVVVVTGRDTPPLPPVENVQGALENLLMRQKEIDAVQALIEKAHRHIDIVRSQQAQ